MNQDAAVQLLAGELGVSYAGHSPDVAVTNFDPKKAAAACIHAQDAR